MDAEKTTRPQWTAFVQKFMDYFPLRWYFWVFGAGMLLAITWLQTQLNKQPSAFNDMLQALILLVKWVVVPLILTGFISVFVPYLLLWTAYRRRKLLVKLESPPKASQGLKQELHLTISPLFQPLLGAVFYKLLYDQGRKKSPKFTLVRRENRLGFAGGMQQGWYRWPLPGIREYEVGAMIIYLEDFLHFFKLALPVRVHQSFFTSPVVKTVQETSIQPTQSDSDLTRIKEWRRVPGEWMHYKNFESNDDVRRIVWKIYARNKELMVRTPEIINPFASHAVFQVSFFDGLHLSDNPTISSVCLDFYKQACFSLYHQLKSKGIALKPATDSHTDIADNAAPIQENELPFALARAAWQNQYPPSETFPYKQTAILCISSLNTPADLDGLSAKSATIAFVPLSHAVAGHAGWQLLQWLWIEKEKEPALRINPWWLFSAARRQLKQHEQKWFRFLQQSNFKYIIIDII